MEAHKEKRAPSFWKPQDWQAGQAWEETQGLCGEETEAQLAEDLRGET